MCFALRVWRLAFGAFVTFSDDVILEHGDFCINRLACDSLYSVVSFFSSEQTYGSGNVMAFANKPALLPAELGFSAGTVGSTVSSSVKVVEQKKNPQSTSQSRKPTTSKRSKPRRKKRTSSKKTSTGKRPAVKKRPLPWKR